MSALIPRVWWKLFLPGVMVLETCCVLNGSPPKICPPRTTDLDLIWKKGLCRCNWIKEFKMRSSWMIWLAPNPTGGFERGEDAAENTMWWWRKALEWYVYTLKLRTAKNCSSPQMRRDRHGAVSSLQPSEGTSPDSALILGFWPPELWENTFLSY